MNEAGADSRLFEDLTRELLEKGASVRFRARGASMSPAIRDGEIVLVTPVIVSKLRKDDIVLTKSSVGLRLHRIVLADAVSNVFVTRGDCGQQHDPPVTDKQILGVVQAKEVRVGRNVVEARFKSINGATLRALARTQNICGKFLSSCSRIWHRPAQVGLAILSFLLLTSLLRAQVAVDTTSNTKAEFTGSGTFTLAFTHTTASAANRLLLVGVSMNITNSSGSAVTTVTYNGTALNFLGAHNDAGATRRVEMWYLLNPASGTNLPINVSINIPTGGASVGVVTGAETFTGVDQTVPLGPFLSADGSAGTYSQLDVPSVVNGMILDTLAIGGNQTINIPGPQVGSWNVSTASGTDPPGVTASASSRTGAPNVPISETFSGASNWSLGAVSINPSTADIGVTTSVSAVPLAQNSTYNITITNNGPSAANNVTLTDTFAATNLSLVSVTPSSGTTCTTTTTINCTLPNPFLSGATATVAVQVSTTAAGFYPNTASIADSGTPPDPNTGNNSYTAVAPVVSVVCSTTTLTAGGTLAGQLNTYFPGTASVAAGATSIPIGTASGSGTIAAGSELLVIQMQDASINTSNSVAYGNGYTGSGFSSINNAGNYEFVTATGAVAGGVVPIKGAGAGGGLVFAYTAAAATATKGKSAYQVVLVPQYLSATLGAVTAAAWNGVTGGILALDVAGQLNLGGATVSVDGLGFRGGAGLQLTGGAGANTDYRQTSPANYTGGAHSGVDAAKGEGTAGTPMWVESAGTYLQTTAGEGYPNGTNTTDASMARGAPGNAGGGGTDADPAANDENAGGGGGGNGGSGGFGGDSWNSNLSVGGEGGSVFPATIDRIALGGGAGAGTRNNSDGDNQASSAAAGGGIIFIRADSLTGTATLTANGASSYNATANDAGGGGGAGGTIVILAANGGESGLTLQANGGRGGNAWQSQAFALTQRHGPGGGGGGGVIFVSGSPASASVAGGSNGLTLNTPAVPYGATSGTAGTVATTATLGQVTGIQSAALCAPDLTLTKSHGGTPLTRGSSVSYTIPVQNISPYGATNGLVTMNDTLPLGLTLTSVTGTGWACTTSGQTISCTRSDALAANAFYSSIAVNASVSQSAPATITNTAVIGGGGEANLLNDTATDTASVISTADIGVADAGSPNPVAAGSNITYTIAVNDYGPSAADNATLVANVPGNTTFVSIAAPAGWSCVTPNAGAAGNVVCTNVDMPGGTAATFTMIVKVNSGTANGTVITATATVNSSVNDPNPTNNSASVSTVVGTAAGGELTVTDAASPNPVQDGGTITYTQVVANTGSSAATGATFTEITPTNTTYVSIGAPAGWTCTVFPPQCTAATIAAGASATFTVRYKVNATVPAGTLINDTVTVNASNQAFGANTATATVVVASGTQADLALSTAASPSNVLAGNNITYTQAITNNGPAAASSVSFSEATPSNTTFASVSAPPGWTCTAPAVGATGTVNCTDPSMALGTEADIIVVVNVPATAPQGTITATSSVTSSTSDPNLSNNSTTVSTALSDECDLAVTNNGVPNPVAAGANITYTQVVSNAGPSNCGSATFTEATPASTTFVSVSASAGSGWNCPNSAPVSCTNSSVAPGSSATITAVYQVAAATPAGTLITDTATVATTTGDTNKNNNTATSTVSVASGTQADVSVTSSATPNPVSAGGTITYTQVVSNAGPVAAAGVVLTETLPANTTFGSLSGSGWTCTTTAPYKCSDPANLGINASATLTFVVNVNSTVAAGSTITQTASVSATTSDPNNGNNSATTNVLVADSAALSVTNSPSPVPVQATKNITYTQTVTNGGPSTATNATLTETLPANTTAVSLTGTGGWTCTVGTLSCTNSSFAPGSATITFVVTVNSGTASGTQINQTATVSSSTSDPNTTNNSATATDVVATSTQTDLTITNSASPTSVAAGSNITYSQTVHNVGTLAATTVSFTQVTPPNTTFQSISTPAGWTCGTKPAVGGTGTITCTDGSFASNATSTFTLVLQVNALTPSGTNIAETDSVTAANLPTGVTPSASATVVVANANSADMAITKTATPNPVTEGTPLTYTLTLTNNGPASATNVTVIDTLPSVVTYLSSTTSQGSCSEAGGTVTCVLGSMANAGTATVTILTIPNQSGVIVNTATVTADQTDPNLANNTATQSETVTAPTSITLQYFTAQTGLDKNGANRVMVSWKTGGEARNIGFNIYREQNGNRVRVNPSLIAGSALLMSGALPKHSGRRYAWIDPSASVAGTSYWLEDVDVNGTRSMHGPVFPQMETHSLEAASTAETRTMSQLSLAQPPAMGSQESHLLEALPDSPVMVSERLQKQFELASRRAVKISVQHEGWYRVTQPDLVKAGLAANVDPASLHLYAEAVEQPIRITGATSGPGGFSPQAAIEFYGTGIDTVFSGTRVYWLVVEDGPGARIRVLPETAGSNQPPTSYPATVELKQHTIYFAALLTQDGENYFGALVSSTPVDQTLNLPHLYQKYVKTARLEIVLQGVIVGFPHDVNVAVNGMPVGDVVFTGQDKGRFSTEFPVSLLRDGSNTVTLTAQNGDYDTSLVQSIRITYPHSYTADSDELKFSGRPGAELLLKGFVSSPLILDISDPEHPVQLTPRLDQKSGDIGVQVPWTSTNSKATAWHSLLAVASDRVRNISQTAPNHPSHWHTRQHGAEIAMITAGGLSSALAPLVQAHEKAGKSSTIIPVDDLYDEFNFGERSPVAIKAFLQTSQKWERAPKYLLLNGRASNDPRNYLGLGELDLVPTAIIPAGSLMTASDDWFSDFTNTGLATIATGRLPVSTLDEAKAVVSKITGYELSNTSASWTSHALLVADRDDTESFTHDSNSVQSALPSTVNAMDIFVGTVGTAAAQQAVVDDINSGQLLVNYLGHGSEDQWAGSDIFDTNSVSSLTNQSQLPVFLIMDCLNGFFEDIYSQPLGVALVLAPNGGGVAVLASSGLNQPAPQTALDQLVVRNIFAGTNSTLGESILKAKSKTNDVNVRRTFVLFGDPAMQIKQPATKP